MRFSVLAEFFCGFAVLDDFFFGFAVSNIPQCPPPSKKYVSRIPSGNLTAGRNLLFDLLKACSFQAASKGTRYKAAVEIFFYTARPSNMSLFFYFC